MAFAVLAGKGQVSDPDSSKGKVESTKKLEAKPFDADDFVRRLWAITDLVMDNHIDPPSRQEMMLGGAKKLFAPGQVPSDLSRRVSKLATAEQFTEFLRGVWPTGKADNTASTEQLESAFLAGLLESMPDRPDYIPFKTLKAIEMAQANRYVGTGIQVSFNPQEKLTQIMIPFPGGPARKAGAKPNDFILEVDGVSMAGWTLPRVIDKLRGEDGTDVTMTVRQPGSKDNRLLKMTRCEVPFETAVGYRRTGELSWSHRVDWNLPIAYIRLSSVASSTPHELRKIERRLHNDRIEGIVLDLRFNSNGPMHEAALVADEWLDSGLICKIRDAKNHVREYRADPDCIFRDCKVVALVDRFTFGGAEAVAAALQDNSRAVLVGEFTQGGLYERSMVHLPDGQGAISLRTALVERPSLSRASKKVAENERAVQREIVKPDHEVNLDPKQKAALMEWQRQQLSPEPPADLKPPEDAQLDKALALLKKSLKKN
ncbi:MAG: S41 family peptidase [Gemmataceae bacterium]